MIQIFVVDWGAIFWGKWWGNGGEIGKKCVTLHFDDKPRKNTLNN